MDRGQGEGEKEKRAQGERFSAKRERLGGIRAIKGKMKRTKPKKLINKRKTEEGHWKRRKNTLRMKTENETNERQQIRKQARYR